MKKPSTQRWRERKRGQVVQVPKSGCDRRRGIIWKACAKNELNIRVPVLGVKEGNPSPEEFRNPPKSPLTGVIMIEEIGRAYIRHLPRRHHNVVSAVAEMN